MTGPVAQMLSSPALIAGLPASRAMVWVGPPLSWSPNGSSCGLVLLKEPCAALKPQLVPSSMLWPPSVMLPSQSPVATIVLMTLTIPFNPLLDRLPPASLGARLSLKVVLVMVTCPPVLARAPPRQGLVSQAASLGALFAVKVLLVMLAILEL